MATKATSCPAKRRTGRGFRRGEWMEAEKRCKDRNPERRAQLRCGTRHPPGDEREKGEKHGEKGGRKNLRKKKESGEKEKRETALEKT